MSAALRRKAAGMIAVSRPSSAPCHTNCTRAHPSACATGSRSRTSIMFIVHLPTGGRALIVVSGAVAAPIEQLADLAELLGAGAAPRQRLHAQRGGRAAERAVEQVAHQLTLGVRPRHPRLVDVRAIALV